MLAACVSPPSDEEMHLHTSYHHQTSNSTSASTTSQAAPKYGTIIQSRIFVGGIDFKVSFCLGIATSSNGSLIAKIGELKFGGFRRFSTYFSVCWFGQNCEKSPILAINCIQNLIKISFFVNSRDVPTLNLNIFQTTEDDLREFFSKYGSVRDARIIRDRAEVSKG